MNVKLIFRCSDFVQTVSASKSQAVAVSKLYNNYMRRFKSKGPNFKARKKQQAAQEHTRMRSRGKTSALIFRLCDSLCLCTQEINGLALTCCLRRRL